MDGWMDAWMIGWLCVEIFRIVIELQLVLGSATSSDRCERSCGCLARRHRLDVHVIRVVLVGRDDELECDFAPLGKGWALSAIGNRGFKLFAEVVGEVR